MDLDPQAPPNLGRTGLTGDQWLGLHYETRQVIDRACLRKTAFAQRSEALSAARSLNGGRSEGGVKAYPCPFAEDRHFHVGRPLASIESMEAMSRAIRDLHGNRPGSLSTGVDGLTGSPVE